ncbi:bifunctional metallophosphatase/5'-nucleotidase [Staphylococcus borealis]|uniref:Bifunctional metallophosphatase/5'-nucleotidase n=1 Tax=Staphylococcus borealis TaxID=2742203 RepID=A0ABX2LMS3_9STAP|nr:bifunctional UDP-sugar hydrolase/5'-nucleotidase [Staphylococcus borealis]NUI83082.1 bifunctional metallophosphatase/5'-nucleotidase [Staphylococcus borealis]
MEKNEHINIDILATSDMHSHFMNGDFGSNIYRAGTYVKNVRDNNDKVILLDSGGSIAGSMAAHYYAVVAPYKRHPMIKLMNAMQYDASGVSPDDFKFGLSFLTKAVSLSRFQWLSANIEFALTKEPYFSTPYIIKEYDNVRLAIVGLTADGLMKNEFAEMEKAVSIEKALLSAKRWIRYIHESEHPDFLIVIYHGGLYKINQTNTRHSKGSHEAEKIMKEIGVIDLMITAQQHQTIIGNDFETVYVQAGQNAQELVHVKIKFKKRTNSFEKEDIQSTVINLSEYPEDQSLLETTYYDRKALEHWSKEIVSNNKVNLDVNGLEDLLSKPHPFTQLLHDSLHLAFDNEITCANVPKNGEKGLKGIVTNEDVYNAYPHPDKAIDITLKGHQIKKMIEYTYSYIQFEHKQLSMTIIDETRCTMWQGFDYIVDMSAPRFNRVTLKGLELDKHYRVTMTDYCYRNYRQYLESESTLHSTCDQPMSTLIATRLNQSDVNLNVDANFIVKY